MIGLFSYDSQLPLSAAGKDLFSPTVVLFCQLFFITLFLIFQYQSRRDSHISKYLIALVTFHQYFPSRMMRHAKFTENHRRELFFKSKLKDQLQLNMPASLFG